jgi:endogenous inhibitor of DNA gyrase (YacG/DUF329 family)
MSDDPVASARCSNCGKQAPLMEEAEGSFFCSIECFLAALDKEEER